MKLFDDLSKQDKRVLLIAGAVVVVLVVCVLACFGVDARVERAN